MQNGSPNGISHQDESVTPKPEAAPTNLPASNLPTDPVNSDSIPADLQEGEPAAASDQFEGPPSKKRKLAGATPSRRSSSRPASPPWKKAGVDGPTSFIQDGRRKSSRVNALSTDLQSPSDKRHTRAAHHKVIRKSVSGSSGGIASSPLSTPLSQPEINGRSVGGSATVNGSPRNTTTRGSASRRRRVSQSPAPGQPHARTRSYGSGTFRRTSNFSVTASNRQHRSSLNNASAKLVGAGETGFENADDDDQRVPRLRIKVKRPPLGIHHPGHVVAPRRHSSFKEWIESEDRKMRDSSMLTSADALEEALKRRRIAVAAEPGGLLSPEVCSAYLPEQQGEPSQQYSHQDHLVAHALYFKKLLDQEHKRHRNTARLFAQWCADAWRKRNKDPEDILREQQDEMRGKRKQLAKDLQKMFDLARAEVDRMRLARWEEERKAEDQQALDRAIKQSTMLFEKRRMEILGEVGSDAPDSSDGEQVETDEVSDDPEDEDNMSSTDSESEDEDKLGDNGDEGLTAEELRLKYANLPNDREPSDHESVASDATDSSDQSNASDVNPIKDTTETLDLSTEEQPELEEVDPVLMDDSEEESTDMDDDMGDSDEDMESDGADFDDDASDDGPGLLGFFSAKERALDYNDKQSDADDVDEHGDVGNFDDGGGGGGGDIKITSAGEDEEDETEDPDEVSLVPNGPARDKMMPRESDISAPDFACDPAIQVARDSDSQSVLESAPESTPAPLLAESETYVEMTDTIDNDDTGLPDDSDELSQSNLPEDNEDIQNEAYQSGEPSSEAEASPGTLATKPSEPESVSSYEALEKLSQPGESPAPGLKTPVPHLLRGTLREYQHFGLDWLAGLYTNHINGILADEMGLGKTIQTIALLAHLAVEHEVWGPHLVVVPTSVILNWEMEFKKWCPGFKIMTYYGNQEERRQKRKGWMDDSNWNVLITSYQLVLQDQQVLKRRGWHYMILDEAHNIKNFRSQRWQALLTFRTRARLLLTGTPLQNNLTELWSLLFFLMPSDGDDEGIEGFADLRNFSEWFRRPVEQILEHGRETMDDEAKQVVTKLHTVLRPYILRRLKADVEKQMPAKYEHVVYCRLSKRQRFLYDGFMSRAQTKETLASGNYLSIINCLMQLRKVCNHPDLFETRPISTSFAMPRSVATEYEIKDLLIRRRLLYEHPLTRLDLDFLNLVPISREDISRRLADDSTRLMAYGPFNTLRERQYHRTNWQMNFNGTTVQTTLEALENESRKRRMAELERCLYFESKRHGRRPVYGSSLIEFLTADSKQKPTSNGPLRKRSLADWLSSRSSILASIILSVEERSQAMDGYVQRFACVTPAAVASGITEAALTPIETRYLTRKERFPPYDPFHEAQMRLSIAFPDKRLLQYDCGKLQRLDKLLRDLKAGGHRALIFTQMTKMLDILEQFLNIHGHRYLRLDGTTKVEQRQILTDRFNNDDRILAFILSSRSGGLGINLTGADTVIFYDLDWNPAMDKQCQDRCHRIGQTRDVHIYRFVSEYTIESNILRKANQKRMLDDVIIQEGEFTTDYFTKLDVRDMIDTDDILENHDEASAAMDRVLENRVSGTARVFEQAEDKEDIDAAKNAQKELEHADDGDFDDRTPGQTQAGTPLATGPAVGPDDGATGAGTGTSTGTPGPQLFTSPQVHAVDEPVDIEPQPGHIDNYLVQFMEWNMKDEPLVLPADKSKKKSKKGKEHRLRKRR
ncbi:SNF2 family helicase/ATPase [Aspergillus heteromorphus CBS 117.55]|uniref:Helicase SWR1 n=1 Tax=Aspergillus heteromorphus CBS 117.55 TaxID=1448321 RepID=A0A317VVU1_9EURO|nr:SNF2 family helicase/ATPase [Aspergillus heteromorphus CBS 117.55]PWY77137.1 SNF2 family helicase/ATPase [Aspergillus heteromorphus CBS 117.55]